MSWENLRKSYSINFVCGYCNSDIASDTGYCSSHTFKGDIRICHKCDKPSYIDCDGIVTPSVAKGKKIKHLPESVEILYEEIRQCFKINAYTSIIMCARKILMHVACENNANHNLSFGKYVQFLKDEGYIAKPSFPLVETILKYGNTANHRIEVYSKKDAEIIVSFLQSILENIYELPEQHKELIGEKAEETSQS